jgi:hypothetical protein
MQTILNESSSPSTSASDYFEKTVEEVNFMNYVNLPNAVQGKSPYGRHSITEDMRIRMIDWMIEVLVKCSSTLYVYLRAVNYLDRFFSRSEEIFSKQDLHITGIISMVLAIKFDDSGILNLAVIQKEIGHNKFSLNQLKKKELEMLQVLGFELNDVTSIDILRHLSKILQIPEDLQKIAEILLLLIKFDLYLEFTPFQEAAASLIISCRSENYDNLCLEVQAICEEYEEDLDFIIICIKNKICEYKIQEPSFRCPIIYLGFDFESIDKKRLFKFQRE